MNILCDTNSITALRLGNEEVLDAFEMSDKIFLSVIVMGELLSGYKNGSRFDENMKFLESFLEKPPVRILGVNEDTAKIYSDLFTFLKKSGTPIPTNDLWIAAQCVETGAVLLSGDRHFNKIPTMRKITF